MRGVVRSFKSKTCQNRVQLRGPDETARSLSNLLGRISVLGENANGCVFHSLRNTKEFANSTTNRFLSIIRFGRFHSDPTGRTIPLRRVLPSALRFLPISAHTGVRDTVFRFHTQSIPTSKRTIPINENRITHRSASVWLSKDRNQNRIRKSTSINFYNYICFRDRDERARTITGARRHANDERSNDVLCGR